MQNRFCKRGFFLFLRTSGIIELTSNTLKRFLMILNIIPAFINHKETFLSSKWETCNEICTMYQHKTMCEHKRRC